MGAARRRKQLGLMPEKNDRGTNYRRREAFAWEATWAAVEKHGPARVGNVEPRALRRAVRRADRAGKIP